MSTIIIVLGNSDRNVMKSRVDRAIEYYKSIPKYFYDESLNMRFENNVYILFSGGKSKKENISEAEIMNEMVSEIEIENNKRIFEYNSKNTYENLVNSKNIIQGLFKNGVADFNPNIVICTSKFHVQRSMLMAKIVFESYNIKYIYTQEEITQQQKISEMKAISVFVNSIFPVD